MHVVGPGEHEKRVVMESTVIIEYPDLGYPVTVRMLPADPQAALAVRLLDRLFDQYVMTPMQLLVFDCIRPADQRDPFGTYRHLFPPGAPERD